MGRVRIVTGPDQGDAEVVFTAAELHSDAVVLNCIYQLVDGGSDADAVVAPEGVNDGEQFELTDDQGTQYTLTGGGGGGEGNIRRMELKFVPAVPARVKELRINIVGRTVLLKL